MQDVFVTVPELQPDVGVYAAYLAINYCPKGRKVALLRRFIIKMGQTICPKCDGNGWYVDDNGNEVSPCDYPGCDGDGFIND